jgi:hypothetical protein
MNKKKVVEVGVVCVLLLVLAGYVEETEHNLNSENQIARGSPGSRSDQVELILDAGDVVKNYDYEVVVPAEGITQTQASEYFTQAKEEVEQTFYSDGDSAECVTASVHMEESYVDGLVRAEWSLDSYHVMDTSGAIVEDALDEDGEMVQATAEMSCGDYREEYVFSFMVYPRELSGEERLLQAVQTAIEEQSAKKGDSYLTLPDEVDGVTLQWREKKQHLVWKVLFFEILVLILLRLAVLERAKTAEKERKEQMLLDYSDVVSKLLILLGSGMTLKQSWNRISAQYLDKRQKKEIAQHYVYEEMLITNHAICDGESEHKAYQKFGERTGLGAYQRLMRILLQNMQTGSRGICQLLEQESQSALEERKALARKLGEEAGTKMLLPLMLMLGIVIAIIMVPAMLSFQM